MGKQTIEKLLRAIERAYCQTALNVCLQNESKPTKIIVLGALS